MSYVYLLTAVNCPAPQELPDTLSLYADPVLPDTYDVVVEGAAGIQQLRAKLNRNSVRSELTARFGGGFVGIMSGLALTAAGLVGTVAAGKANVSGPVELAAAATIALVDGVTNYIWISKNGTLNKRTSSGPTPLLPPDTLTTWCYLGAIPVSSGTPGNIDLSGVVYLRGLPYRRTADATTPADTPTANSRLLTRGSSSWWLWDGSAYVSPLSPDHTVNAESGDAGPGALDAKTKAGSGITLSVVTDGGVRKLLITADPNATDWKNSVRAASTGNLTLSGAQTIDGVACIAGDRVLAKNQTTASENGIYVVAAGAWSRATDADTSAEVTAGMVVFVSEGTTQRDTIWAASTNDAITLGSTALVFGEVGAVNHVETFTVTLSPGGNSITVWECDFSARGTYLRDYLARCVPDGAGILVDVLDSDRTNGSLKFQIQVASDAPAGSYGGAGDVSLVFTLEGPQWVVGGSPSATPTLTQDTHDYAGGTGGGSVLNPGVEELTADGTLSGSVGSHRVVTTSGGGIINVTMPAAPADGDRHTIIKIGSGSAGADDVKILANTGQAMNIVGLTFTRLQQALGENVTYEWKDSTGRWIPVAYVDLAAAP